MPREDLSLDVIKQYRVVRLVCSRPHTVWKQTGVERGKRLVTHMGTLSKQLLCGRLCRSARSPGTS